MPPPLRTQLAIAQPCPESWEAMTPALAGRHCAACQKVVVDFTHKTDAELLAYLAGAPATSCGRFRPDQLNRPLHPAAPVSRWRAWLVSGLALGGVLGAGRATAQNQRSHYAGPLPEAVAPVSGPANTPAAAPDAPAASAAAGAPTQSELVTVRGVVLAEQDGQGLPGVTVLLKGSNTIGTMTNRTGEFALTVPAADSVRLLFASIGYVRQEHTVATRAAPALLVRLAEDTRQLMGELVITGYRAAPPWPWHVRFFYQWGRYWVTRPFRRE